MNTDALVLSLEVAALATAVAGVAGVGIAAILARTRFPGRDLVDAIVTAPMVLPPTVLGYYLLALIGRQSAVGRAYESLVGSPIVFTRTAAVVAAAISALPFIVKSARASMESVDPLLIAAARTLGASPSRVFFRIVLPLSRSGIAAGIALGFARALGDFGVTLMIAGDLEGRTQTASLAIYDAVLAGRESDAGTLSLFLAALGVSFVYAVNKLARQVRLA